MKTSLGAFGALRSAAAVGTFFALASCETGGSAEDLGTALQKTIEARGQGPDWLSARQAAMTSLANLEAQARRGCDGGFQILVPPAATCENKSTYWDCLARETVDCKEPQMCECYWDEDCPPRRPTCLHSEPCQTHEVDLKLMDGMCVRLSGSTEGRRGAIQGAIHETLAAYAYAAGVDMDDPNAPPPDESPPLVADDQMLGEALEDLTVDEAYTVHSTVRVALDQMFGFDFVSYNASMGLEAHGGFRAIENPIVAREIFLLLDQGFAEGLLTGIADPFTPLLTAFWEANSTYTPMHLGRCYPHGHVDQPFGTALDCQTRSLNLLIEQLTTTLPPA